ncbi:MAG TPA: alpha/beta hydrolase [Methanobacterium sp.]|nr:alpha/beta hydrolase [Methanobacterium sp.]
MRNANTQTVFELLNKKFLSSQGNIFQLRKDFEELYLQFSSNQELQVEKQKIDGIDAFKICAEGVTDKDIILFFHGGGFTIGSTKDHMDLCGKLSAESGYPVFSIDYSLAPENKFPAALEDCLISYLWLLKQGIKPSEIVLAGISSGATLVLSLLLHLKEKNIEFPAGAVCMSPAVDMLFQGHSIVTNRGKDWLIAERLFNLRKIYFKKQNLENPIISPIYGDLHGLPPILIQAGSHELLLDDIIDFHKKAKDSDVEINFELWKDMFHCFQIFSSSIPEGQKAIESAGEYIKGLFNDI